jgi:hypothetical protein
MEIRRNQQAAAQDTAGKINWHQKKSHGAGNGEQNPVGAGYKCQYSLLNFHLRFIQSVFPVLPRTGNAK